MACLTKLGGGVLSLAMGSGIGVGAGAVDTLA
jgi:hypothetical protein